MRIASIALATGVAFGCFAPGVAGGPLDLSSGSAGYLNTPGAGAFIDTYTFSLVAPTTLTGIVSSAANGSQNVDFNSLILTGPSGSFSFAKVLADPFETWAISTSLLDPGNYTITQNGTNSAGIATYAGNITLGGNGSIGAVSEPETYALILAGLTAIQFTMRRRRRDSLSHRRVMTPCA